LIKIGTKNLLKPFLSVTLLRIFSLGISYLLFLFLTFLYTPDKVGIFIIFITLLQIASILGRFGFDILFLRFSANYFAKKSIQKLLYSYKLFLKYTFIFSFVTAVLLYIFSEKIAVYVLGNFSLHFYIKLVSISLLPYSFLYFFTEALRSLEKIGIYILLQQMLPNLIIVICILVLYILAPETLYKYFNLIFIIFIVSILFSFITSYIIWKKSLGNIRFGFSEVLNKSGKNRKIFVSNKDENLNGNLILMAFPLFLSILLIQLSSLIDPIILKLYTNEKDVGLYGIAFKLSSLITLPLIATNAIVAPRFAAFYGKGDLRKIGVLLKKSRKIILLFSFPTLVVLILFSNPILHIFGKEFLLARDVLIILSIGQFINSISGSVGILLQMTNRQKILMYIIASSLIIKTLLASILIPKYNLEGMALASVVGMLLTNILCIIYIRYSLNIPVLK
jgi:O-antigen/teichoic acid export membrane protein